MKLSARFFWSFFAALFFQLFLNLQLKAQDAPTNCPDPNLASWEQLWSDYLAALKRVEDPDIAVRQALACTSALGFQISLDEFTTLNEILRDLSVLAHDRVLLLINYLKNKPSLYDEDLETLDFLLRSYSEKLVAEYGFQGQMTQEKMSGDYETIWTTVTEGISKSFESLKTELENGKLQQAEEHFARLYHFNSQRFQHFIDLDRWSGAPYCSLVALEDRLNRTITDQIETARGQKEKAANQKKENDYLARKKEIKRRSIEASEVTSAIQQKLEQRANCLREEKKKKETKGE